MNKYGYARVSSSEQNATRQLIELSKVGVEVQNIFIDKSSGKDFNRPAYQQLVNDILHEGDVLYVLSIDRLGRNYEDIREQWRLLTREKKVDICIIDMPLLDTRYGKDLLGTFIADIVLQILSFVAESERTSIKSRQRQGIEAAKIRGIRFGRPNKALPADYDQMIDRWRNGIMSTNEIINKCKISRATFYRTIRKF